MMWRSLHIIRSFSSPCTLEVGEEKCVAIYLMNNTNVWGWGDRSVRPLKVMQLVDWTLQCPSSWTTWAQTHSSEDHRHHKPLTLGNGYANFFNSLTQTQSPAKLSGGRAGHLLPGKVGGSIPGSPMHPSEYECGRMFGWTDCLCWYDIRQLTSFTHSYIHCVGKCFGCSAREKQWFTYH